MAKKRRKVDQRGRNSYFTKFVMHHKWQLDCPAWRSLSSTAKCLEIEFKLLYNGANNGELFLSVRDAATRLNVAPNTAAKAFKELIDKGFIKEKEKGSFHRKARHATTWILTEFEYSNLPPTKDFMRWDTEKSGNQSQILRPTVSIIDTDYAEASSVYTSVGLIN